MNFFKKIKYILVVVLFSLPAFLMAGSYDESMGVSISHPVIHPDDSISYELNVLEPTESWFTIASIGYFNFCNGTLDDGVLSVGRGHFSNFNGKNTVTNISQKIISGLGYGTFKVHACLSNPQMASFGNYRIILEKNARYSMQDVEDDKFVAKVKIGSESTPQFVVGRKEEDVSCVNGTGEGEGFSNGSNIRSYDGDYVFNNVSEKVKEKLGYGEFLVRFCLRPLHSITYSSEIKSFSIEGEAEAEEEEEEEEGGEIGYVKLKNIGEGEYALRSKVLEGENIETWFDVAKEEDKGRLKCELEKPNGFYRFKVFGKYDKGDNFEFEGFMDTLRSKQSDVEAIGGGWYDGKYYAIACGKDDQGNLLDFKNHFVNFYVMKSEEDTSDANKPKVEIHAAENITKDSAVLKGEFRNVKDKWFVVSEKRKKLKCNKSGETVTPYASGGDNYYYAKVSGLSEDTTYYYKACYTDFDENEDYTSYESFKTKDKDFVEVVTQNPSGDSINPSGRNIENAKRTLKLLTEFILRRVSETNGKLTDQDWTIIGFMLKDVYSYMGLKK
ncbi:hypothetical protein CSB11_02855 [Candidatus Campbellbacteria bacterium]|nr:MAG: hypothetical protein CSB11_02855 [Candidatus Campbellbacteria bacterium]